MRPRASGVTPGISRPGVWRAAPLTSPAGPRADLLDLPCATPPFAPGPRAASPPVVSLREVSRRFGRGGGARQVLERVSLRIDPATAVAISGRNGTGKTTLLRIISGVLLPDAGQVLVRGLRPDGNWRRFHEGVGLLSAGDRGLYARLTVRGHLEYCVSLALLPRAQRRARVEAAIERFALGELTERRAERLSQGQRQRLRLALTLVHEPVVLLLDEPRNSLDDEGQQILQGAVEAVLGRGGAVVWCSPPGEAQPPCVQHHLVLRDRGLHPA
jgi:ABC-2 type transport system ATP-binding protein